jgi:hypothetical protein
MRCSGPRITYELDGGQLWPEVGDWQAVTAAVVHLTRAGQCDATPLGLDRVAAQLLTIGPTTVSYFHSPTDRTTKQLGR